jgi:hypothetical protein
MIRRMGWTDEDRKGAGNSTGPYADLVTTNRLVDGGSVLIEVGLEYQSAVRNCFDLSLGLRHSRDGTDEDVFRQEMFEKVVTILEDEASNFGA